MNKAGFTLIEVLIALAILGVSLPVLLGIFSDTLHRTRQGEDRMIAASLAETLLAKAGIESPLQIGRTSGNFGNGYRWQLEVEPYRQLSEDPASAVRTFAVRATVGWGANKTKGSLSLATLRLAPKTGLE